MIDSFESRLTNDDSDESLFSIMKRHKLETFDNATKSVKIKKKGKDQEIKIQRYIVGALVGQSSSHNEGVDINNLLNHPLPAVSHC